MASPVAELFALLSFKTDKGSLESVMSSIRGLKRALIIHEIGNVARGLYGIAQSAGEAATHLISNSAALGLTIKQTQEWGYVAEQSGSNIKEFAVGMSMFEANLRKLANGTAGKQLKMNLAEAGFTSQSEAQSALNNHDLMVAGLMKVSDKIHSLGKDTPKSGALGRALFGARAGRAMTADLARGRQGLEELIERRRALGELDENQAHTLRDMRNRIEDVHKAFSMVSMKIVADLAPDFIRMAEAAAKWIGENKDVISGALSAAFHALAFVVKVVADAFVIIADVFRFIGENDFAKAVIIGIAAVIMGALLPSLIAVGEVLAYIALEAAVAMLPFLPWVALFAGIAYAIIKIGENWDEFVEMLSSVWEGVKDAASTFWDWLGDAVGAFGESIAAVGAFFADLWDGAKSLGADFFDWADEKLHKLANGIKALFGSVVDYGSTNGLVSDDLVQQYINRTASVPKPGFVPPTVGAAMPDMSAKSVSVHAPTNITINGVKGADQAVNSIQDAIDQSHRHAAASLGGEVR